MLIGCFKDGNGNIVVSFFECVFYNFAKLVTFAYFGHSDHWCQRSRVLLHSRL